MHAFRLLCGAVVAVGAVAWLSSRAEPASYISIQGRSLEPVVHDGSTVAYIETTRVKTGDYIVFADAHGRKLAKRVVAQGGDHLEIKNDYLYVNGRAARNASGQDYVLSSPVLKALVEMKPSLDADDLFVLGEAYRGSLDSSHFFVVPRSRVIGRLRP